MPTVPSVGIVMVEVRAIVESARHEGRILRDVENIEVTYGGHTHFDINFIMGGKPFTYRVRVSRVEPLTRNVIDCDTESSS